MTKEDIKRTDLAYSMLRRVIIRADFTSMLNTEKMVEELNDQLWFSNAFNTYSRLKRLDDTPPYPREDRSQTEWEPKFIRRFDDCNIPPENKVSLDITNESVCLDIQCDDKYESIDPYLQLVVNTISYIISADSYVRLRRLAIRKIDGESFPDGEGADKVFEYFDQKVTLSENDTFWQRNYTDSFVYGGTNVKANYSRSVKVTPKEGELFVFVLDIDTFLDSEMLENARPTKEELQFVFFDRLNVASFELFKRGVKLEFLKSKLRNNG